jgi:hypothetical protein
MTFGDGMGCGPVRRPRHSPRRRPGLRPGMTAPCQELADGETEKGAFDKKVVFPQSAARKDKSRDGAPEGVGGSPSRPVRVARHGQKDTQRRPALHPPRIFGGHGKSKARAPGAAAGHWRARPSSLARETRRGTMRGNHAGFGRSLPSFRGRAISAFTRVFDALWRGARNPYSAALGLWIPGSRACSPRPGMTESNSVPCEAGVERAQ